MYADLTIRNLLAETAANTPVPGGGSISALNGALAAALTEMVANLTVGKKKYAECEGQMKTIALEAAAIREQFISFIDQDSQAYERVFAVYKLPKETEAELTARNKEIQLAMKQAAEVPMCVAEETISVMETITYVAQNGNQNAVTDACVAMMAARTCALGALLNVRINLASIDDLVFRKQMKEKADLIEADAIRIEANLLGWIKSIL